MTGGRKHVLKSEDIIRKIYKTSNNYTTLIQHSNREGVGALFNALASKSKEKEVKLLFMKSSYTFHIIVLKESLLTTMIV